MLQTKSMFSNLRIILMSFHTMNHFFKISKENTLKNSYLCIVMEYADGGDLYTKIKEQKKAGKLWPEDQILDWFVQICLSVKHIHDKKILHRDLKSQNIFMTSGLDIKMGDFGIGTIFIKNTRTKMFNRMN